MRTVVLYVARGGPSRGEPDYKWLFETKKEALEFLANQHGLDSEEFKRLKSASRLKLDRAWHGSVACSIQEMRLSESEAKRALAQQP